MLKKITKEKKQLIDKELSEPLPSSEKIYIKSDKFKGLEVGMRKINLEDKDNNSIIVYDTSGFYTDKSYDHDLNKGLAKIRENWITKRTGIVSTSKTKLKYLNKSNNQGIEFPKKPPKNLTNFCPRI